GLGNAAISPAGDEIALLGYNANGQDSVVIYRVRLSDGVARLAASFSAEAWGGFTWMENGEFLVVVAETRETHALYRVGTDGETKRLGLMPYGFGTTYSIARDG